MPRATRRQPADVVPLVAVVDVDGAGLVCVEAVPCLDEGLVGTEADVERRELADRPLSHELLGLQEGLGVVEDIADEHRARPARERLGERDTIVQRVGERLLDERRDASLGRSQHLRPVEPVGARDDQSVEPDIQQVIDPLVRAVRAEAQRLVPCLAHRIEDVHLRTRSQSHDHMPSPDRAESRHSDVRLLCGHSPLSRTSRQGRR